MKSVVLDATENNAYEKILSETLKLQGDEAVYYKLKDLKIIPCRACGACGDITPGKCALKDDMQEILRNIASGDGIIMVTPISFGGYSALLKKAVDRFMVLGLPFLSVKGKRLIHPMRYGIKTLIGIGIAGECPMGQEENFKLVVERNAINMQSPYRAIVFSDTDDNASIRLQIEKAIREVRV